MLTSYNFLALLQKIFNLEHDQLKFLDIFFIYYLLSILGRRELNVNAVEAAFNQEKALVGAFLKH